MFWDKLRNAKRQPLLLYDVAAKRGWLVPELSAILHLALTWAYHQDQPGVAEAFTPADVSSDGGSASYMAIQAAKQNALPGIEDEEDFAKELTVKDIVKRLLERISQIKEQQQEFSHCSSVASDGLTGYEYCDIALFEEHLIAKRAPVDASKTGGWLKLVEKWPDMAVILCSNAGEPIRLANYAPVCQLWAGVPEGRYLMVAAATCVKRMSERSGGDGVLKIYNGLYCTVSLVGQKPGCCLMKDWPCCNPLFEIKSTKPRVRFSLNDDAALIFGNSSKPTCWNEVIQAKIVWIVLRSLRGGLY